MHSIFDAVNIFPSAKRRLTDNQKTPKLPEATDLTPKERLRKEISVFSVFSSSGALSEAVNRLVAIGFHRSEISTFVSHDGNLLDHSGNLNDSKIGEGMLLGAFLGIVGGAIFGLFSPYEFFTPFRELEVPKFFSLLLFSVIWGMIGGVVGALIGRSIPEYKEEMYETSLKSGAVLVLVKVVEISRARLAKLTMSSNGGESISPAQLWKV